MENQKQLRALPENPTGCNVSFLTPGALRVVMTLLVKNALVLTQDSSRRVLPDCDVLVKGNKLAKVGREIKVKAETEINARGKILLPGLINTHTHAAMTLLRGYGEGLGLNDWLQKKIWPAEKKLRAADVYAGSLLACAEMARSGTTAFNDMYYHPLECAKAVEKAGLRATLAIPMLDFLGDADKQVRQTRNLIARRTKTERVQWAVAPHAIYSCSRELLEKTVALASESNALVHTHLSETRGEASTILQQTGRKPAFYLNSLGAVNKRLLAAHCTWLDLTEIELFAKARAAISLNPVSNFKLASGIAPARRMVENGCIVSLGTDGAASNNSLSMLETMKFAALAYGLSAQEALDMATLGGARALHLNAGSIEEGRLADFILIDSKALGIAPVHDPAAAIVFSSSASCVTDSIIDGQRVLKDGKLAGASEKSVVEEAVKAAKRLTAG